MVAFLTKYPGHHFNKCFKLAAGKIGNWASRTKARGQNQPYWPIFCNEPSAAIQAHRQGAGVETFHWNSQPQQFLLHDWVGKGAHLITILIELGTSPVECVGYLMPNRCTQSRQDFFTFQCFYKNAPMYSGRVRICPCLPIL